MDRLEQLRADASYLNDAMRAIVEADEVTSEQKQSFADGEWLRNCYIAEGIELEARRAAIVKIDEAAKTPENVEPGVFNAPNVVRAVDDPFNPEFIRSVGVNEAFTRAVGETTLVTADAQQEVTRKASLETTDPDNMRGFREFYLRHGSEDYARGFFKRTAGLDYEITPAEAEAMRSARQWCHERGLSLTAANGGAMIPTHLDPSVVLTNAGQASVIRDISRVVPVTSNVWNGVSSAGVTFAWSSEGGDSSDVAATYAQPSVTCYKWHGTVPVSIEAFGDIQGLGDEIAREVADGKERLLATAFATGSGTAQPWGIVSALVSAGVGRHSIHATNNAFTSADVIATQNALGPRYQDNARWISSLAYGNRMRAFGDDKFFNRTVTFDNRVSEAILGQPWGQVSDMTATLSTASNYSLVYGDFSNFLIAERVGTEVEFVPLLMSPGNSLPNGRRGWYAWGRTGSDSINDSGFILSVNPAA